jgi:subtilisin family serine protease
MRFKAVTGGLAALALIVLPGIAAGASPATSQTQAPLYGADSADAVPGRYIVVMRPGAQAFSVGRAEQVARDNGSRVEHRYRTAIQGFAAALTDAALADLRSDPAVAYVEADQTVSLVATQSPATWGLDRIDQRNLPLSNSYTYNFTGAGVTAYIIDTGIRFAHSQFGGRAVSGFDAIDGGAADDCHGHGTHVAGTVGGSTDGVAKNVSLVGVRVLNCQGSGTNSQVIAGIDWVTNNHQTGQPAVANMSLGGGASSAIDTAVNNSINDGVTYAIAAGNSNANACNSSPARVAAAITVGATTSGDARASFSNFGTCLDIFAPGQSITSAWHTSNTATNTISGTSMATPHVAGVAALALDETSASPTAVRDRIVNTATPNVVSNAGSGSPNRLLYSLLQPGGGNPPNPQPSVCTGYQQSFTGTLSGAGDSDVHPNGTYFQSPAGLHRGCLDGPTGADFDLYLYRWNGFTWTVVAQGITSAPDETVTYNGTAGYYYWRVRSYSGSGSYTGAFTRP